MHLNDILKLYNRHPQMEKLRKMLIPGRRSPITVSGLYGSSSAVVMSSLAMRGGIFFCILPDAEQAGYFYHDMAALLPGRNILFFPSAYRRAAKYAQHDAAGEVMRMEVVEKLAQIAEQRENADDQATALEPVVVVTHPAALAERVARPEDIASHTITLRVDGEYDLSELEHQLLDVGFRRTDYVYEPGEFAVRGSILDIYSYSADEPYRLDFFGDEVESIRTFDVTTQLSREKLHEVSVVPEIKDEASQMVSLTSYLPARTILLCSDLSYVREVIDKVCQEGFSRQADLSSSDEETLNSDGLFASGEEVTQALSAMCRISLTGAGSEAKISFNTSPQPLCHKNFDFLRDQLADLRERGFSLYICADSEKQLERLDNILSENNEKAQVSPGQPSQAVIAFRKVSNTLHEGFADADLMAAFFTDHQIFDRFHKYNLRSERTRNAKMSLTLKEIMQFQPGDFIVHIDHGIGRFAGLVRVPAADGTQQEMIKLVYQRDDIVLVSIHSLHKLSKYKGRDGEPPKLSRLGTGAWEKMKDRAKTRLKDIARDLIRLYSERRRTEGFAFSPDTFIQHELEAGFKYEDTPDQLRVTQEVKRDMESRRPMDRLVCGDVGFGKTEIAVRAALKATVDNKQVAVLVPTTVLALQHYKTFCERLSNFPVKIEYLSRARTPKQVKEILAGLADGSVNIVVGTHKLIGKSVRFKDLGLLIIDEEQKFGVGVKEKLRMLRTGVDTLTMSATPIPRTLQFSLMGARDFSVIETPPPNRRPIQTEVHVFSPEVVAEAVNFEMSRNGQTFIVTNRISALENLRQMLRKYVPDARVAVGHGQMPPAELEQIVTDFINYDYDVLISTTIVENGIDIPNANTIIIDAAQHFGLSDLHQMRGRVGRSDRKAFCYLLAPPLALLPDDARRRLQAIEQFSDLGSGIHIAMQDLDIRGAGNLLGAEQSGFIADLGYETYIKILNEAMEELGACPQQPIEDSTSPTAANTASANTPTPATPWRAEWESAADVDCDLHAFFPETYVPGASERMMLYRELDGLKTDEQIACFRQRMEDRFGPMPEEGEELLRIAPLRRLGSRLGCERIVLKAGRMTIYLSDKLTMDSKAGSETLSKIIGFAMEEYATCRLSEDHGRRRMTVKPVTSVGQAMTILQQIHQFTPKPHQI